MHIYTLKSITRKEEQKLLKEHWPGGHAAAAPGQGFLGVHGLHQPGIPRISGGAQPSSAPASQGISGGAQPSAAQ